MIGGQVADLEGEGQTARRRAAGIHPPRQNRRAAARQPAHGRHLRGRRPTSNTRALSCYGEHVGLAFQIVDDILDVEESSEALGKTAGKDAQQHKITFPAVYGLRGIARAWPKRNARAPTCALAPFGERAERLHELADLIVHRKS